MNIGDNIKNARQRKYLSSKDLAKLWGKTPAAITEIEKGRSIRQWESLNELCDILDVSADYLLGRTDRTKENS